MKKALFNELLEGVKQMNDYRAGKKVPGVRVDKIESDSVSVIRTKLGLSQSQFAKVVGISVDTLQNWEQGRRQPTGPARMLLKIAAKHPEVVLEATG